MAQSSFDPPLPSAKDLCTGARKLAESEPFAKRTLEAIRTGIFMAPDGRVDHLGEVRLSVAQLGLIAELAVRAPTSLCVDVGFGMGSSVAFALSARRLAGLPLEHLAFDPFGLPENSGSVVESHLAASFGSGFKRIRHVSQVGLGQLYADRGPGCVGMTFIDGDHRFDNVLVDFVLADLLCPIGGYIVLDDTLYPAIESVVNFIRENRSEFAMDCSLIENTCVLQKTRESTSQWCDFEPFEVGQRRGWSRKNFTVKS